jgi:GR25 family glycosyltransferase involved in LPS biosynthesis
MPGKLSIASIANIVADERDFCKEAKWATGWSAFAQTAVKYISRRKKWWFLRIIKSFVGGFN